MKHQRGSTSYNKQFRSSGTSRAIRISRDPRSVATRPLWLSDILPAAARWMGRAIA
jgi:hypothetical protein